MSLDTVDMLHAAEDRVGTLTHALTELLAGYTTAVDQGTLAVPGLFDAAKRAQDVLGEGYCRCDCDDEDYEPDEFDEFDDACGCPHHNKEETP